MSDQNERTSSKSAGLVAVGIFGGLATAIMGLTLPFVWPAFRKVVLPYVPATEQQICNVLQALKHERAHLRRSAPTKALRVIDLGSGDGRIVIECAKHGIQSHGVELNPWLVLYSKYKAYREGVHKLASFQRKNLFKVNLADFDAIVVFGVDSLMPLIEKQVSRDCNRMDKQVRLVACRFPLPNWEPFASFGSGIDQVWLYEYFPSPSALSSQR